MAEYDSTRHFPNPFQDFSDSVIVRNLFARDGTIEEDLKVRLTQKIQQLTEHLEQSIINELDERDYSVYTGTSGIALLYLQCASSPHISESDRQNNLHKALDLVKYPLRHLKRKRVSFICGDAGPLAVGAVLYDKLGNERERDNCIERLIDRCDDIIDPEVPDELLFGRVGYLFSLLFIRKHIGQHSVKESTIKKVFNNIILSGQEMSKLQRSPSPLMYEWHEKKYLGAAHGLAGLFFVLMQLKDPQYQKSIQNLVKPSIDYLMAMKFPSGNYPSSVGSATGDKLVHWCHGAPGWIHMFIAAYQTFGEAKYLEAATSCADVVWSRGILKKGYGICHGVAGNAYAFLAMYRLTGDQKYLYRAVKFAEWCLDYGKHGCRLADRPLSLFEGIAGTIFFLVDILNPMNSRFPAFEL